MKFIFDNIALSEAENNHFILVAESPFIENEKNKYNE